MLDGWDDVMIIALCLSVMNAIHHTLPRSQIDTFASVLATNGDQREFYRAGPHVRYVRAAGSDHNFVVASSAPVTLHEPFLATTTSHQ